MSLSLTMLVTMSAVCLCSVAPDSARAPVDRATVMRRIAVADAESLAVFPREPATNASVSTSGAPTSVASSAATVVIIPGPIGSAFSMRHVTEQLAEAGVRTVVIDLLGMGFSARPERADYTLAAQARRVSAVLDTLRLTRVVVLAQGTSITVAYHLAAARPERVRELVSIAGGAVDKQGTSSMRIALALAPLLNTPFGRAFGRRKFRTSVREESVNDEWCTPEAVRAYLLPFERDVSGSLHALKRMNDAVEPIAMLALLHDVRIPVHLLVGEKHSPNGPTDDELQLLRRALESFRVDTVARAGTLIHEERADAVVRAVREATARAER
jgi:pimeloyl-ACP methyl ester carboxylesterase